MLHPSSAMSRALVLAALATFAASVQPGGARGEDRLLEEAVGFSGAIAYLGAGAPGFVLAAVRNGETAFAGFGETAKGSGKAPDGDTMMRIGSISKTFCGDALSSLAAEGALALTDPLQDHLGPEFAVPEKDGRTLRLIDLITQASGLPREVPNQTGGTPDDPFAGNTVQAQIDALKGDPFLFVPGDSALYSNFGHDLLGAALAHTAGKPYADVLAERVLTPIGMADTVFNLRPGDEARAMQGHNFDGSPMPWVPSPVTIGCAGGLYSTANDMLKWMSWHLAPEGSDDEARRTSHAAWLFRDGLDAALGLDDGGPMHAMGLGWVIVAPEGNAPLILNKSGGLQGMFIYVAIAPGRGVGAFAGMNAFSVGGFPLMVQTVNNLVAELANR